MSDIFSNDLNRAMLRAKLDGNEMKVLLAYISKGGWKAGTEVYLPEALRLEYGLSNSTVKRHRKALVEKGWLIPTGHKTRYGVDKYVCVIPEVVQNDPSVQVDQSELDSQVKLTPEVVQIDPSGGSFWSTEVTKEVTEEVTKESNQDSAVVPPASLNNSNSSNKKDQDEDQSYSPIEEVVIQTTDSQVGQIEPPSREEEALAAVLAENADLAPEQIDIAVDKVLNRAGFMSNIIPIKNRAIYAVYDAINGELDWS